MLAARAGELSVRGDELALSETADRGPGACSGGPSRLAGSRFPRGPWQLLRPRFNYFFLLLYSLYSCSTRKNKSNDI